jgi:hypothetical protein
VQNEHVETYQLVSSFGEMCVRVWAFKSGENLGLISRAIMELKLAEDRLDYLSSLRLLAVLGLRLLMM